MQHGQRNVKKNPLHVSSTTVLIFWRTVVLVHHLVSLSDCSVHRLREDSNNLCPEQSPKDSDDSRCCTNTTVLLKMSTVVLETCRGIFFGVWLNVHLSIFISVINQIDAQNFCFTISLFHASTCFEHYCARNM